MTALSAIRYNAIPILVDIVEACLDDAKILGIAHVINAGSGKTIEAVREITQGVMAQVVIEASGSNSAIRETLSLASFTGRIILTGWPKEETPLPTNIITFKDLDVRGSRTSAGECEEALELLSTLNLNPAVVSISSG